MGLLTPGEVADLFRVSPKTVTRWAQKGHLAYTKTPGGHRRYFEDEVQAKLRGTNDETGPPPAGS